ncbi:class I SAM-dependent methyltransferase [Modicisalibacter radicis]|uniref:class I SAM-dependent methyltransferase n=1 Tax=Halomonas sp. EAR18 TaxID=2518972 RepID=UPI00109C931B|nr:class I SAM-dependent methyltransferase [Halomonas sp. EAR18]
MTQTFDSIDSLIGRLKAVARQVEADEATTEPPPFAYRERFGELLDDTVDPLRVSDPLRPRLEELVAAHHGDEIFLQRVYRTLMGRDADHDGLSHYLGVLPRAGRLYVLAELLCADEARDYLARHGVTVPRRGMLTLPFRLVGRLGPLGRVLRPPMRLAYRLASIALRPRMRLMERIASLEDRAERRDTLMRDVLIELDGELQRQQAAGNSHEQRLKVHDERFTEQAESTQQQSQRVDEIERHQPALWSALQQHRRAVERLVEPPAAAPTAQAGELLNQDLLDAYYLAFEDACRGSEAAIYAHLRQYQPQWDQALEVGSRALDLGCGRGEWLKLLAEQGFVPHGVDLNVAMIDHCRDAGFEVEQGDIIQVLRQQGDDSHALISAFHLAEHLPFAALYAMIDEAQRVLAPGGVLIVETPNPENLLVGSHTFYHDPTHLNPLTPTAMSFLLRYLGFADVEVRRFNPYPEEAKVPGDDPLTERVNGHLCGPQDFAVVGRKAAPAGARELEAASDEGAPAGEARP